MKQFTTATQRGETVNFELDGETFEFTPPKIAKMMMPLFNADANAPTGLEVVRAQLNWLSDGLPADQAQRISDRLNDSDDGLDFNTLTDITKWLIEQVGGRPSGSQENSSAFLKQNGNDSTVGQQAKQSIL